MSESQMAQGEARATGFTLRGDQAAEERVRRDLCCITRHVREAFGERMQLAALVGSYARGEGAMRIEGDRTLPHNDYDLLVVLPERQRHDAMRARRAGLLAAQQVGVEVDVAVLTEAEFLRPAPTLFWLDATRGGLRWLGGDEDFIDRQRPVALRQVPLDEAGRLLANRALGLALSGLGGTFGDDDVIARHGHKAVMAAGDALLLATARYAATSRERAEELTCLGSTPRVTPWLVEAYWDAMRFRHNTSVWRPRSGNLRAWFNEVRQQVGQLHLDFESWRVGAPADAVPFASWNGELFRQRPDARLGARLAALRAWFRGDAPLRPIVHPRERLARASVAVAYGGDAGREQARELLGLPRGVGNESMRVAMLRLRAVGS